MGIIINGKEVASKIRLGIKAGVEKLAAEIGRAPRLAVVLVGEDPASHSYVRNKEKGCAEVGIEEETIRLPGSTAEEEILRVVQGLNKEAGVDGILVQLPLPKGIDERRLLDAIAPEKDVDGLHYINMGKLLKGEAPMFVPCTPSGIMELIASTGVEIKGKEAVVVGRSNIVGKPMALLLLEQHATVTICHSRTKDLGEITRRADILVAAIGRPGTIKGDMVKPGAVVIDVGTSRINDKWVGDVEFETASQKAAYITPVPGGVGPMTITMLLKNTLKAAQLRTAK